MDLLANAEALLLAGLYVAGVSLAFAGNRTALHIGVGNVAWLALLMDPWWAAGGALLLLALAGIAHFAQPVAYKEVLAGERDLGPITFFAAFALVAVAWAWLGLDRSIVLLALLPMAFADPVGFYVGRAWGAHGLPNHKTLEGSIAVFAAAWATLFALAATIVGASLPGAAIVVLPAATLATLGEGLAPRHLDNLLMTIGALVGWLPWALVTR